MNEEQQPSGDKRLDRVSDSFNQHSKALRANATARDFIDLQDALADRDVGRMRRHMPGNEIDPISGEKKSDAARERLRRTLDWLLVNDVAYRQAHEGLMDALRDGQRETEATLERTLAATATEREIMDELLASAAKLPDGRAVFRDKHGIVRDQNGERISDDLVATIEWRGDEPSYEKYLARKQRIGDLEAAERELRGIETELGDIHNTANTNTDPLTEEQLDAARERTDSLRERVKEIEADIVNHMDAEPSRDIRPDTQDFTPQSPSDGVVPAINLEPGGQ